MVGSVKIKYPRYHSLSAKLRGKQKSKWQVKIRNVDREDNIILHFDFCILHFFVEAAESDSASRRSQRKIDTDVSRFGFVRASDESGKNSPNVSGIGRSRSRSRGPEPQDITPAASDEA